MTRYNNEVIVESDGINGLINPVGLVVTPTDIYVADNTSGFVLHFDKYGKPKIPTRISVPAAPGAPHPTPFGLNFNSSKGFVVSKTVEESQGTFFDKNIVYDLLNIPSPCNGEETPRCPSERNGLIIGCTNPEVIVLRSASSSLITSTSDGLVAAFSPLVDPIHFITRYISQDGASYSDQTLYNNFLYLADNRNGKIDVLDSNWQLQCQVNFPFNDPNLISGYYPFGIKEISGQIYVTYGFRLPNSPLGTPPTPGLGFINVFTAQGAFVRRFSNECNLDSSNFLAYGLTTQMYSFEDIKDKCNINMSDYVDSKIAKNPCKTPKYFETLLVGDHYEGIIARYTLQTGKRLQDLVSKRIPTLWNIFQDPIDRNVIYYTAFGVLGKLSKNVCCN